MQNAIDNVIAYRVLKLLTTPWTNQIAYELGIINAQGIPLKKTKDLRTPDELNAYTILHRLVFRMKRLIERTPVGASQIATYAVALALVKECYDQKIEPIELESIFLECIDAPDIETTTVQELLNTKGLKRFSQFAEDASAVAGNNTGGIVGTGDDNTLAVSKTKTIFRRGVKNVSKGKRVVS